LQQRFVRKSPDLRHSCFVCVCVCVRVCGVVQSKEQRTKTLRVGAGRERLLQQSCNRAATDLQQTCNRPATELSICCSLLLPQGAIKV
jgi:hypothetical protein